MRNMLGVTRGIIVTHWETARSIVRKVGKRIAPSRNLAPLTSFERQYPESKMAPLQTGFPFTIEHMEYAVMHEHARILAGLFSARFGMGWSGKLEATAVELASSAMASALNWDEVERARQMLEFRGYLTHVHRATLV